MLIPEKGSRVQTPFGLSETFVIMHVGYASWRAKVPGEQGNFLTPRMVKGFNRLEVAGAKWRTLNTCSYW